MNKLFLESEFSKLRCSVVRFLFFGMNFSESKEMNGKRNECVQNARISSEKRASDRDRNSNKKELNRLFSI